jgi:peptidoglycan/xylan/chitin deacetylase (PgdA/CDA1 family)
MATWVAAGEPIGNHTYSHVDLRKVTLEQYLAEIDKNEATLLKYSRPEMDYKVFRHPYLLEGATRARRNGIRKHLFDKGYKIAEVTVDYWDFMWNKPVARCLNKGNAKGIEELRKLYVQSALNELKFSEALSHNIWGEDIRHILLAHIGIATALFIDDVLKAYEDQSVKFITLQDAMADPLYDVDTHVLSKNGPNFLDQMVRVKKAKYPPHKDLPLKKIASMCL